MNRKPRALALAFAAFVAAFGARLVVIDEFGVSMPFMDEWAQVEMYAAYVDGHLTWADIVAPHNEHRLVLQRLWALGWFTLNGGWDPKLLETAAGLVNASTCAFLVWALVRSSASVVLSALVVCCYAVPFSYNTILAPFQVQFYLQIFFSTIGLWWWCEGRRGWAYGAALLAYLSLTSGALLLIIFSCVDVLNAVRHRRTFERAQWLCLVANVVAFGVFWLTLRVHVAGHDELKAHDVTSLFLAFGRALAFPLDGAWLGVFVHAPVVAMLVAFLRKREGRDTAFVLALAGLVVLSVAAMAAIRGGSGYPPAVRYWDLLLLGVVANGAALVWVLRHNRRALLRVAAIAWFCLVGTGLTARANLSWTDGLPLRSAQQAYGATLVNRFLETGDRAVFLPGRNLFNSYPFIPELIRWLSKDANRRVLPTTLGNSRNADRLRELNEFALSLGWFVFACGAVGMLVWAPWSRRRCVTELRPFAALRQSRKS